MTESFEFKEAGLPEIEGQLNCSDTNPAIQFLSDGIAYLNWTGAFELTASTKSTMYIENGSYGEHAPRNLSFKASKSNPIYGKSITVQPTAMTVMYIIKIKK